MDANFQEIAFRGQGDANLNLVPCAFRLGTRFGYRDWIVEGPSSNPEEQAQAEFQAVFQFVKFSDLVGLPVPGDSQKFRGTENQQQVLETWPPPEVLETLAVAQHHGIPTRLLDFSYDPPTAALFASRDALELEANSPDTASLSENLAVWAVDLRFVRLAWEYPPVGSDRIREITVPRSTNPYLHAQHGLFLMDTCASSDCDAGVYRSIEDVVCERAQHWSGNSGFLPVGKPGEILSRPVVKIELPRDQAIEVMSLLHREGKTLAHLVPSYDGVVEALELMRHLGI